MSLLILGLVIFLGAHSLRIFADAWRTRQRARIGELRWKAIVSLVSLAGFALLCWGFGMARADTIVVWLPPPWTRHVAALLVLVAFILLASANLKGTRIKAALGHPMTLAVKVWALAHLVANGTLADIVLFGSFLAWSVLAFASARRRDRAAGTVYPALGIGRDIGAVVVGVLAWAIFARYLHLWLTGVRPLG
jgi:uncharacterized membrane protein